MRGILTTVLLTGLLIPPALAQVGIFEKSADWTLTAAGNLKAPGKASVNGKDYTLEGNGNDIWNNEDEGYYLYTEKTGSFSISALLSWDDPGTNQWSKMIVMIREKGDLPGSKNFGTQLRGNNYGDQAHVTMRVAENGGSSSTQFFEPDDPTLAVQATVDGLWMRTTRIAELNLFFAEWSFDGTTWNLGYSAEIPMQDTVAAGLAITNHENDENIAVGTFKSVTISNPPTLPLSGARAFSSSGFMPGDSVVVSVKVLNPNKTATAIKVDDMAPTGWTISEISNGGTTSGNSVTWNINAEFGYNTLTYKATAPAQPEAVNTWSGTTGSLTTGGSALLAQVQGKPTGDTIFDLHADILKGIERFGDESLLGSAAYDAATNTYTVSGSGWDVWDRDDAFHFLYTAVSGDFRLSAIILHDESDRSTSTDVWIKGMLMARQNLSPGSPNFTNRVRRDGQYSWQLRAAQDGTSSSDGNNRVTFTSIGYTTEDFPRVMTERIGDQWSIYYEDDAGQWVQVQSTQTLVLEDPVLVGIGVTAHQLGSIQYSWFKEVKLERLTPANINAWELY